MRGSVVSFQIITFRYFTDIIDAQIIIHSHRLEMSTSRNIPGKAATVHAGNRGKGIISWITVCYI